MTPRAGSTDPSSACAGAAGAAAAGGGVVGAVRAFQPNRPPGSLPLPPTHPSLHTRKRGRPPAHPLRSRFGDYRKDDPDSFQLRPQLSYYPQFMFNFRRSQFIQARRALPRGPLLGRVCGPPAPAPSFGAWPAVRPWPWASRQSHPTTLRFATATHRCLETHPMRLHTHASC